MAELNLEKAIERGHKIMNKNYALDVTQLFILSEKNEYDCVADSFAFGYYQGMKAAKAEMKKKARVRT